MKTCPVCGAEIENGAQFCFECGAKYVESDVKQKAMPDESLLSKGDSDAIPKAAAMEMKGLDDMLNSKIKEAPLPKMSETAKAMIPQYSGLAITVLFGAGKATEAGIFYILGALAFIILIVSGIVRVKDGRKMSKGEVMIRAAMSVFTGEASGLVDTFSKNAGVAKQLDMMKKKADEALARQKEARRKNQRKILLIALAVVLVFAAGVTVLAVQKNAKEKAATEYAAQPEWVRLQDSYEASDPANEATRMALREQVVAAMLAGGESATAEEFFFANSEGELGDVDCATLIARYYKEAGDTEALHTFTGKLKLRYDSDTKKVRNIR